MHPSWLRGVMTALNGLLLLPFLESTLFLPFYNGGKVYLFYEEEGCLPYRGRTGGPILSGGSIKQSKAISGPALVYN